MNDLTCQRPACGHTESVHVGDDIFLYECTVNGCDCKQLAYVEPVHDWEAVPGARSPEPKP